MWRLVVVLLLVLAVSSCSGESVPRPSPSLVVAEECVFPFPPPAGWGRGETRRIQQGTHVGTEQVFHEGHVTLAYSAGVLRDQFETAPISDDLLLTDGRKAALFAADEGINGGWRLFWYGPVPCKQFSVIGVGANLTESRFLSVMREVGVLAAP